MDSQIMFGVGALYLKDASGSSQKVAVLQEVSFESSASTKELMGAYRFPVDVATGAAKVSVKAKFASVDAELYAAILGGTAADGATIITSHTAVVPASPFTVTVPNVTGFEDRGVLIDGHKGVKVAATPEAGEYAVSAVGVYTFAAADTGKSVTIDYGYTVATGKTVSIDNALLGQATKFELVAYNEYSGKKFGLKLHAVVAPKLSVAMKNEDHTASDVEFTAFANAANQVGQLYFA